MSVKAVFVGRCSAVPDGLAEKRASTLSIAKEKVTLVSLCSEPE